MDRNTTITLESIASFFLLWLSRAMDAAVCLEKDMEEANTIQKKKKKLQSITAPTDLNFYELFVSHL